MTSTPEQRAALQEYFLKVRDHLRLQAWDIEVVDTPPKVGDNEACLEINPQPRVFFASVRVGTFFTDPHNSPEEHRIAVCHELFHLVQSDLLEWITVGGWRLPLSPDHSREMEDRMLYESEKMAEWAARAMAPTVPLPEWPKWD